MVTVDRAEREMLEGERMDAAAVSETHIGVVFFVGDRAYKLKKPVDMGFLDFSTRERRERACQRGGQSSTGASPPTSTWACPTS